MARKIRKKRTAPVTRTSKSRPTPGKRKFTFLVPVHLQIQHTFDETEVENLDNERSPPEVTEAAAESLSQELREYLEREYQVDEIEALEDSLNTLYLGEIEE